MAEPAPIKLALHVLAIPLPIPLEFWPPEFPSGFRHPRERTAFVPMPEAAVNENDLPARAKHKIGTTG